jgi:uncharacterized protein
MKSPSTCIDCHVHYYPSEVSGDPASFARAHGEPRWESVVSPAGGKGLQAWADETRMLADMDAAGVDEAWLQGWYWQHPHTCELQQRWYAELLSRHPKRLHAFTPVAPGSQAETQALLQCAEDQGFSGIGEVHPAAQGFELDDPWWLDIANWAQERGWPILIHVTEPVGRHYEPRWETPTRALQQFIERFPDLRIILAHVGGLLGFHENNPYIRKRWRNVFYDTAALPLMYDLASDPAVDRGGWE